MRHLIPGLPSLAAAISQGALEQTRSEHLDNELRKLIAEYKEANPGKSHYLLIIPDEGATAEDIKFVLHTPEYRPDIKIVKEEGCIKLIYTPKDKAQLTFRLEFSEQLPVGLVSLPEPKPLAQELVLKLTAEFKPAKADFFEPKPRYKEWEQHWPKKRSKKSRRNDI